MKNLLNISYWSVIFVVFVISILAILSEFGIPKQNQIFIVQSGSMEPAIKTGSLILVQPEDSYVNQDIVTYKKFMPIDSSSKKIQAVTHRIVAVGKKGEAIAYLTKGDANKSPDMEPILKSSIIGKVAFSIPYVGYLVGFAKTQLGFILLMVIPATIIIYSEIVNIKKELTRMILERKIKKLIPCERLNLAAGQRISNLENDLK